MCVISKHFKEAKSRSELQGHSIGHVFRRIPL